MLKDKNQRRGFARAERFSKRYEDPEGIKKFREGFLKKQEPEKKDSLADAKSD